MAQQRAKRPKEMAPPSRGAIERECAAYSNKGPLVGGRGTLGPASMILGKDLRLLINYPSARKVPAEALERQHSEFHWDSGRHDD